MNVIMDHTKEDVSFVEVPESQMLTTVKNARFKRKIEMVVQKLSILGARRRISSMRGKSTDSKNGSSND